MGRSKKNWDALVDYDGNYGVHVQEGIFPGSDGTNIKGSKGDPGRNGLNGDKGSQGAQGRTGPKGPNGETGAKGDKGEDGDKMTFADLNLTERDLLKGETGQKGEEGEKGDQGDDGVASPLLTYRGAVDTGADLPANGNSIGDVYYNAENGQYFAWDGARWQSIGTPVKGEGGDKGDKGNEGAKGLSAYEIAILNGTVLNEQQWLDSLKGGEGQKGPEGEKGQKGQRGGLGLGGGKGDIGEKGEKGGKGETLLQSLVLDDYYDKDNVDDLIDGHFPPEYAFHYGFSSQPNNVIESGQVSFLNRDRNFELYDPGPVLIKNTADVVVFGAPPFEASPEMLVINYPYDDPYNSRSTQYQVLQVVYALNAAPNRFEAYTRRCQPATNLFTPWQPHTFNEAYYYTKLETELLLRNLDQFRYHLESENNLTDAYAADLVLKETNRDGIVGDAGRQTIQGTNGIVVYRKDGKMMIDGQALSSGLNYIGPIGIGINPYAKFPAAVPGDFAVYSDTNQGTAWNGDQVVPGDWVVFSEATTATPEWSNLFVGQGAGVVSVDATGLLERQGTLTNPIIHLDENSVVVPEDLKEYPTWAALSNLARLRRLGSLSDVQVGTDILGFGGIYDNEVLTIGVGLGLFKVDEPNQTVQISLKDALNRPMIDFFNEILVDESAIRVTSADLDWSLTSKVLNKQIVANGYELTFADPNIVPLMKRATSGWNINILESSEIQPNSVLMWDQYIQKWVAGPQMLDLFLTDARYLRLDTGGTVRGDIVCNTSIFAGEILSSKTLEVQENIAASTGTLGTVVSPFKGEDNNDIVTVGKLFDELANYTPGGTGDYLPLTGGTLSGPLNLERNLYFNTDTGQANIYALGNSSEDLVFFSGPDAATVSPTFSIGSNLHSAFNKRIANVGDAVFSQDALNRQSADRRFLQLTGGTMTGPIEFKNTGFNVNKGGTNVSTMSADGFFSAARVNSNQNTGFSDTSCLNFKSLKANFLEKNGPEFTGNMRSATSGASLTYNTKLKIGSRTSEPNLTFERDFVTLNTELDVNNQVLSGLREPSRPSDAATKKYVDENGGGGGGGFTAHLGSPSGMERGAIVLGNNNVLSIVL